eukprot:Polyplicarium_translucidae@DN3172_c0_g1_i2.p1
MEGLDPGKADQLWGIFRKHTACWLRPRSAQFRGPPACFRVTGRPVRDRMRPLLEPLKVEEAKHVEEMLRHGVVRPSKSPWGSVPVFVKKKTGGWRMALDYRRVNQQLEADVYPLPLIWELLEESAGKVWYTCLDLQWGFWNVPLAEESKACTAAEFQRAMDWAFGHLRSRNVFVYIDDIVISTDDWGEHLEAVGAVLEAATKAGVFLGHVIDGGGIRPSVKKIEALRASRPPC